MEKNKPNTFLRFCQPLRKYYMQVLFLIVALGILCISRCFQWPITTKLHDFLNPVIGLITFPTTLAILYFQGYQRWEDNLEKRLTVRYVYVIPAGDTTEIARIEKAYLSGEGDIRNWAQQLGRQIMGDLSFDLILDREIPKVVTENKNWYKDYEVIIYLTTNPLDRSNTENRIDVAEKFLERKFQHSVVQGNVNNLPIIWKRNS